jgi:PPOX class probable F420-dependent enzyme
MAVRAQAQTLTQFDLNGQTGYEPYTTVTQATDGNFYGTTGLGGPKADGNIFRMTPTGEITNLYNFCSLPKCADGRGGQWPPILAPDGNLYLVTSVKSANILYKLTVDGELTNLFTFCSKECPGPLGITLASDGNFYGTSGAGGVSNNGTIFRVSLNGEYSVLHSFCSLKGCTDGTYPLFPPIQSNDGNFYGTTFDGGSQQASVVYKLTPSGTYTVIHNFCAFGTGICAGTITGMPGTIPTAIRGQKYISLATFRKSGAQVATPVWFGENGDKLYVMTRSDMGKTKRVRNNPQVTVAPCSIRGKLTGAEVLAQARLLPAEEHAHARQTINRKYLLARLSSPWSKADAFLEISFP